MKLSYFRYYLGAAIGLVGLYHGQTLALDVPDAGQTLRTLEAPAPELPKQQTLPLIAPKPDTAPDTSDHSGLTVKLNTFQFTGNSVISSAALSQSLAEFVDKSLTLGQLRQAAAKVADYYHQQGYFLARAWLPQQEIAQGMVTIAIAEGRYDVINVDNKAKLRPQALAPLKRLQSGDVVDMKRLEPVLLTLNDIDGVAIQSSLAPGRQQGSTNLLVQVQPKQAFSGDISLDNYGNYYTGQYRLSSNLQWHNAFGLGDNWSLRLLSSDKGQYYSRVAWQTPFGQWGTQAGVAYSWMKYALAKDFDDLHAKGSATVASVWLTQPVLRRRAVSLFLNMQWDEKRFAEQMALFSSRSSKKSQLLSVGLSGTSSDAGQGINGFSLNWRYGKLVLNNAAQRLSDQQSAHTQGSFAVVTADFTRLQRLTNALSLLAKVEAQWSNGNLDGSEKMALGGIYGIRAYPQSEASGDTGFLSHVALRYRVLSGLQLSTFVDYGKVRLAKRTWAAGSNHTDLSSAGLGLDWQQSGWQIQSNVAWRISADKASSAPEHSPRFWFRVAYQF